MCDFFSFCTEPERHGGKRYYFDWKQRVEMKHEGADSHSHICEYYGLNEDKCNKYEYNPLLKAFWADHINSEIDDRIQAQEWVEKLDWKKIIEPLIIKPIINPFELPKVEKPTEEQICLLYEWVPMWTKSSERSIWNSVESFIVYSCGKVLASMIANSMWETINDYIYIWDTIWNSTNNTVWSAVAGYISSFFDITYQYNCWSVIQLWEHGLVPSYDGKEWRLHSGKNADIVYREEIQIKQVARDNNDVY